MNAKLDLWPDFLRSCILVCGWLCKWARTMLVNIKVSLWYKGFSSISLKRKTKSGNRLKKFVHENKCYIWTQLMSKHTIKFPVIAPGCPYFECCGAKLASGQTTHLVLRKGSFRTLLWEDVSPAKRLLRSLSSIFWLSYQALEDVMRRGVSQHEWSSLFQTTKLSKPMTITDAEDAECPENLA